MSHVHTALNRFFEASSYAVVGASKDPAKFGNKVLKWYQSHSLPIVPIHPKEAEIEGLPTSTDLASFLETLRSDAIHQVSLSIVTPPKVSLAVVKEGIQRGVGTLWLQPGAEDVELVSWVQAQPPSVQDRVIYGGPCILVSGEQLAGAKGKL